MLKPNYKKLIYLFLAKKKSKDQRPLKVFGNMSKMVRNVRKCQTNAKNAALDLSFFNMWQHPVSINHQPITAQDTKNTLSISGTRHSLWFQRGWLCFGFVKWTMARFYLLVSGARWS